MEGRKGGREEGRNEGWKGLKKRGKEKEDGVRCNIGARAQVHGRN